MPLRVWLSVALVAGGASLALFGDDGVTVTPVPRGAVPRTASSSNTYRDAKRVDPVAQNGPIFQGWTKPKLALVITGLQQGYLEPCGCAGLENQKGGLSRRHTLLLQLAAQGWPLIPIDAGGQVQQYGRQTVIKFGIAVEALTTMNYEAVALGATDLKLPTDELLAATANFADDAGQSRFVSANVDLFDADSDSMPAYRIVERNGVKVGITSVLGDSLAKDVTHSDVVRTPAVQALKQVVGRLQAEADVLVLLAHATNDEASALAKQFPQFQIVVSAGGADEPTATPVAVAGTKTMLVDPGHKGMYAIVLGLYDDPNRPWRYQRVPLDARFADSPEMKALMTAYQGQLQQEGFEGLGLRPMPHPSSERPRDPLTRFAGSQSCQECHPTAHGIWSKSPHSHATETLMRLDPARHHDPECLSCHSTGWNPQEYFPYEGGFLSVEQTAQMMGNGCENCHGPAAAHVEAEQAKGAARKLVLQQQLRQKLKLTKATVESTCEKCHDHDNSPEFDFHKYWPKVEHRGKR
jgi:hypothetical protein